MVNILIFIAIYFYFSNWFQIESFYKQFFGSRKSPRKTVNSRLSDLIYEKSGLEIRDFLIFDSEKLFALMPGIPSRPSMIFSKKLYETFSKEELEYVTLHETAHCLKWHVLKFAILQLGIGIFGILTIYFFPINNLSIFMSIITGVFYAIVFVQLGRYFEKEAEEFAASNIKNPEDMISAVERFKRGYPKTNYFLIRRFLFGWNIFPEEKIEIAKRELEKRK